MKNSYLVIYLLLLTACASAPPIYFDFDKTHSFGAYKTFSWAHTPPLVVAGNLPVSKETERKATQAIKDELSAKGFVFTEEASKASFLVVYTLGARDDIEFYQTGSSVYENKDNWLWGHEYHSYYFDRVIDQELTGSYTKGVFAVDIFDTKLKAPVWHGKASKSLDESEISADGGSVVEAVKAVLLDFPPKIQ